VSIAEVVFRDEPTGAELLRVPGRARLLWWLDVNQLEPAESQALAERWEQSPERRRWAATTPPPGASLDRSTG
jgi:hypothetical protein